MANHLYNYASGHSIPNYSSLYTTGSDTNAYDTSLLPSRYDWSSSSSLHSAHGADGSGRAGGMSMYSQLGWGERESLGAGYGTESMFAAGIKRQAEALYHQSALGIHNSMGQSEALFSTNSLLKRSRVESASHLPIYPQRPGEKDCTHYMLTRTCKFGENCKFDHPIWVPEGGIPDWKEVPLAPLTEFLPERPGEPDCPYFIKTQKCKFGYKCKFNHPKDQLQIHAETADASILPERPSEPLCTYYAKTGKCKFGANCIFNHPKDFQIAAIGQGQKDSTVIDGTDNDDPFSMRTSVRCTPALLHNTKGLPIRPGEQDCPFYLKTGSCKYGAACRYNHPERTAINLPLVGSVEHTMFQNLGTMNSSASIIPSIDPSLTQAAIGLSSFVYPQRPGEPPCDFYMKTGHCKFAERCKFHHPVDGPAPPSTVAKQASKEIVKLTLAGLPRREGATRCSFYMKTGHCMYGAKCRYDHPPPGEVAAMATNQDAVNADGTAATQEKTAIEVEVEQT